MLPPAPPRFSTITGLPSASPSSVLIIRAAMSVPPPAGKQTIRVNWRSGYSACAIRGANAAAPTRIADSVHSRIDETRNMLDMRFLELIRL